MILEQLTKEELQDYISASKRVFEDAFADGMPYEEVNLRYREFRMLQDELNRRVRMEEYRKHAQ